MEVSNKRLSEPISCTIPNQANKTLNIVDSEMGEQFHIIISGYATFTFTKVTFRKMLTLAIINGNITFDNCILEGGFSLNVGGPESFISMRNSSVKKSILIKGGIGNFSWDKNSYTHGDEDDEFVFENNRVVNADFTDSKFVSASFKNTSFSNKVNFSKSTFGQTRKVPVRIDFSNTYFEKVSFNQVDFEGETLFIGSEFKGVATITDVKAKLKTDFTHAKFHDRVFFDRSKFSFIVFEYCEFFDVASFKDIQIGNLIISKTLISKGADFLNARINRGDRETFRIIKNEFIKINNNVEALHYKSKEMIAYEDELKENKEWGNLFLVFLNKISNKHGLSWSRGLLFTVFVGIVFYSIYLYTLRSLPFSWGWNGWRSFWDAVGATVKYFIRFFIVTHDLDFMNQFGPTAMSFVVDFFGRIFIGYGIYQTIQAFRKFGKI